MGGYIVFSVCESMIYYLKCSQIVHLFVAKLDAIHIIEYNLTKKFLLNNLWSFVLVLKPNNHELEVLVATH
jgi:hypothetical protein